MMIVFMFNALLFMPLLIEGIYKCMLLLILKDFAKRWHWLALFIDHGKQSFEPGFLHSLAMFQILFHFVIAGLY